jgi:Lysyl oxidase
MRRTVVLFAVMALGALVIVAAALAGRGGGGGGGGADLTPHYPDLRTVVPQHLNFVNQQGRELLRFSNGIANTGAGPWALRPEHQLGLQPTTTAIQEIRSSNAQHKCGEQPKNVTACYTVLGETPTTIFEYHPTHNHWHTASVALFEVRRGSPSGPVVGGNSIKTGFCLIDLVKLDGNAPTSEKVFWDCYTSYQGIAAGWIDQYHHATDGQEVDLTGVPSRNDYYLVSTSNPDGAFLETTTANNAAWVKFSLQPESNGNRKVTVLSHSACDPGLCGEATANRG